MRLTWQPGGVNGDTVALAKNKQGALLLAPSVPASTKLAGLITVSISPPTAGITTVAVFTKVPVLPSLSRGARASTTVIGLPAPGWEVTRVTCSAASSGVVILTTSLLSRVRSNGSVALLLNSPPGW